MLYYAGKIINLENKTEQFFPLQRTNLLWKTNSNLCFEATSGTQFIPKLMGRKMPEPTAKPKFKLDLPSIFPIFYTHIAELSNTKQNKNIHKLPFTLYTSHYLFNSVFGLFCAGSGMHMECKGNDFAIGRTSIFLRKCTLEKLDPILPYTTDMSRILR